MATVVTMEFACFAPLRDETEVTFKVDGKVAFHSTIKGGTDDNLIELLEDMEKFLAPRLEGGK